MGDVELPNGKAVPDANANEQFKKEVEKSKANLQAESPQASPPKRGRGRPPKVTGVSSEPLPATSPTADPAVPAPDLSKYLIPPLLMVSKIPAARTEIPELALTAEEAGACAASLNMLVQEFAPAVAQMSSKSIAAYTAIATFSSIAFQKYSIYALKMQEKGMKTVSKPAPAAPQPETSPFPVEHAAPAAGQDAADYFKKAQ